MDRISTQPAAHELKLRPGDQPLPVPNDRPDIQSMVLADITARRQVGITRYGTALQAFNGRDALRDLYEELLDACMYARQEIAERAAREQSKSELRKRIADAVQRWHGASGTVRSFDEAADVVIAVLPQECRDPIECGHEAALGETEATVARVRDLAESMRGWCSPNGVAATFADRIDEALGQPGPAAKEG